MQTFGAFLAALVATGCLAAALPAESQGGFSVPVVRNTEAETNGFAALQRTLNKFNMVMPSPDELREAATHSKVKTVDRLTTINDKRWTGHVATQPLAQDSMYITEVHIGTPAQKLRLDIDTGSSDLWVFSTALPPDQVNGQRLYNPKRSQSAKKLEGATWKIHYADQSGSSGDVYIDNVSIGGLRIKGQAVGAAKEVSRQFTKTPDCDGLLGLAFSSLNTIRPKPQLTFLDTAKGHIKQSLFTANLNHHANGTYNFGFIDKKEHKGPITYTPVNNTQGFWGFSSPGYVIDGVYYEQKVDSIVDTGTTLMYVPENIVDQYWLPIPGAILYWWSWAYLFPCDTKLPDFAYKVEGSMVTIPGEYLDHGFIGTLEGVRLCYGGLQSNRPLRGFSIHGDVALKSSLVVFDEGNMRLGFAPKL
ncbi:hypothetical protein JDV02_002814 [Purpureocillium takamizusanense]|uniref:Peptidase A1 domain-containing protein n=1 Tax=Purpureocillium takamizusanense TaxID=2060973 RepID=A0A9Q8QBR1_9HYPO|nr:uncharacterized protein JDV02_002814 [Purpureocillium takamizusanense]UNI16378.1 hypothetical protein JDV02_002814 [Purpureocillium takamizusanense]